VYSKDTLSFSKSTYEINLLYSFNQTFTLPPTHLIMIFLSGFTSVSKVTAVQTSANRWTLAQGGKTAKDTQRMYLPEKVTKITLTGT
jgi:hypothetical protein